MALLTQVSVNDSRRVVKPTGALIATGYGRPELHKHMPMIWHYYKAVKIISLAIKTKQRITHDLSQVGLAEITLSVALIEVPMPAIVSMLSKAWLNLGRQSFQFWKWLSFTNCPSVPS